MCGVGTVGERAEGEDELLHAARQGRGVDPLADGVGAATASDAQGNGGDAAAEGRVGVGARGGELRGDAEVAEDGAAGAHERVGGRDGSGGAIADQLDLDRYVWRALRLDDLAHAPGEAVERAAVDAAH